MTDDELITPDDWFNRREEIMKNLPPDEQALFAQMQADYAEHGKLSPETVAWIDLRAPNALLAARNEAEQELMKAWRDSRPAEGSYGPSDLTIMEAAWAKLTVDQQHQALHHDLFGSYMHHTRDVRESRDRAEMDRTTGASYLDPDDVDVLMWAKVHGLEGDETVKDNLAREPKESVAEAAWVTVPYDTMWRVMRELELLQARDKVRRQG